MGNGGDFNREIRQIRERGSVRKGSGTKGDSVSKWVQSYRAPVSSECRSVLTPPISNRWSVLDVCLCNTYDCQDFVRFVLLGRSTPCALFGTSSLLRSRLVAQRSRAHMLRQRTARLLSTRPKP